MTLKGEHNLLFAAEELNARIDVLRGYLAKNDIDLAILSQNSDVFYYSGSIQPLYVVVPTQADAFALARKGLTRINAEVFHIGTEPFTGGKDLAAIFARRGLNEARRAGLTLDTLSYASATRLQKLFPQAELTDIAWDIRLLRMVKSEAEIAIQRRAGEIQAKVPEIVRAALEPGITELELTAVIESYFRLNGHGVCVPCRREGVDTVPFGVCSSGTNSLAGTKFEGICAGAGLSPGAPYGASRDTIPEGAPIILDFGFILDGYIIDQTRMASIGKPSDEVIKAYDAMVEIEREIIKMLRPGTPWEAPYNRAVEMAESMGYADTFMGVGTERVKFVGHGVGTELDEPPYLAPDMTDELAAGMVVAIEPKVALPGIGVIGIEDTLVIRDNGVEVLTTASPDFIITRKGA